MHESNTVCQVSEASVPTRILSDEEVLERVRAGETTLYEVLMRRHRPRLHFVARNILRDDAEAEDAVQEALSRALLRLDQFEGRCSFQTWVTRITANQACGRIRNRPRFETLDSPDTPHIELRCTTLNPEEQVVASERRTVLHKAIHSLPEPYRRVLGMRELEEMSTTETAELLGITDECVKIRLHRAKALLRRKLLSSSGGSNRTRTSQKTSSCRTNGEHRRWSRGAEPAGMPV